jgi:hypothetical protein
VEPLIETAEQSWGWHDLTANEVKSFDPKLDVKGPVPIATVVSKDVADGKKARLIVWGDSDFAMNANFGNQGNGNLFRNTVKWLARDENFISIKTKSPADRPLSESSGRTVASCVPVFQHGPFSESCLGKRRNNAFQGNTCAFGLCRLAATFTAISGQGRSPEQEKKRDC